MGRRKEHPRVPLPVVKCVEETVKHTIVTRLLRGVSNPGRGGGGWAGAGGVEERLTERERQREILRKTEGEEQTAGENFCERTVPGEGWVEAGTAGGGGGGRWERVW